MRISLLIALVAGVASSVQAGSTPEFPYKAYVMADKVYVRSGPGDDYYPTDQLKSGDAVEVYRHDPGGWCAIRPPAGSFSWVSGRYLEKPNRDHIARVTGERVASRVGSRINDTRDVIQVRLQKGEMVEVLATQVGGEGHNENSVWYKIAPPSGEFRWIQTKHLDPDSPRDGISKTRDGDPRPPQMSAAATDRALAAADDARRGSSEASAELLAARTPVPPLSNAPPVAPLRTLSPEEFQRALDDLDLELSILVAEDPSTWDLTRLRPRAETLLVQANTAVERGRARILLTKIGRFDDLKKRNDATQIARADAARITQQVSQLDRRRGEIVQTDRGVERFDGVGRLAPVTASNPGGPRYALVERDGAVRCYVTPAPGLNLQSYVGREVGVVGIRGYMPEQRAQHVTAKHISILDDAVVR